MVELIIDREGGETRTLRLGSGAFILGRGDTSEIVLDDAQVSRRHARLLVDGEDVVIEDLDTANGVWVDGDRVETRVLADGDAFDIHPFRMTVYRGIQTPEPPRDWLEIVDGPGTGTAFELHGSTLGIGRAEDQAIRLPDQSSSRAHAILFLQGTSWNIRDNQSANGIMVNERRVREMELQPGDVIAVGNTVLKLFHAEPPPIIPRRGKPRPPPSAAPVITAPVAPRAPAPVASSGGSTGPLIAMVVVGLLVVIIAVWVGG
jgi:pSer/pThr/pTyr-binding forkhead associated (FHA) protein